MNRAEHSDVRCHVILSIGVACVFWAAQVTTPALAQESWDAIYIGGTKVGHMHVAVEPVKDKQGRELVRVRVNWELNFKRGNDRLNMRQLYGTIETRDGAVLRLDTRTQAAENDIRTYGDVVDGAMTLILETGGQQQKLQIPWGPEIRGPYGSELSLSRQPMKPGEERAVKTYIPDLNRVCVTTLQSKKKEDVELGSKGEKRSLLRVEQVVSDENGKQVPGMASTLWVDDSGQIMKSKTNLLGGMLTYRTTKEGALGKGGGPEYNLLYNSILKVPRKIPNSEQSRDIVYRVTMTSDQPTEVFPNDRRQLVQKEEAEGSARIEVRTQGPNAGEPGPEQVAPEFLRANPLVNSEDPNVVAHMRRAIDNRSDPWQRAVAIETWVADNVRDKNFGVAFATAGEVARNLRGDCSEHSVLTAAMCRAAGIPARCVVGLVYVSHLNGFGPHMWNEVYVNRRWVAIDAAFKQSEVDATHIKLSDTSLDGVAPLEAFLPVLRTFTNTTLEAIEIR